MRPGPGWRRIRAWLEMRENVSSRHATAPGAGHLSGRGVYRRRFARAVALLARANRRAFVPPNRRRAVSPFRGSLAASARAGRALAAVTCARRDLLARNRPDSTSRPLEKAF